MPVTLTSEGLLIDGQIVPVYSGAVHYWRLERARWPNILDQVKALGFEMVETYIPWAIHEIAPGRYDWGQDDPRKDVEAFMRLCEERELWLCDHDFEDVVEAYGRLQQPPFNKLMANGFDGDVAARHSRWQRPQRQSASSLMR